MERSTIILGNGLGMSLDPDYFSIETAMEKVWNDPSYLTTTEKDLISSCLVEKNCPNGEDDLDVLHRVVVACEYLAVVVVGKNHWLSIHGQQFPKAIRQYLTGVAWYFHKYDLTINGNFIKSLSGYICKSKSHLATLNYDNLLYQELIERDVLKGFDGALVDGFCKNGFNEKNLKRKYGNEFGYYMHLHGSPLFINENECIIKQCQGKSKKIPTSHLVLTHVEHKPSVIDNSYLLKTYWLFLRKAIRESKKILLFGYSGQDTHLNRLIKDSSSNKKIGIVEWSGSGEKNKRVEFWENEFGENVELNHLSNILDFSAWEA